MLNAKLLLMFVIFFLLVFIPGLILLLILNIKQDFKTIILTIGISISIFPLFARLLYLLTKEYNLIILLLMIIIIFFTIIIYKKMVKNEIIKRIS